MPLIPAKRERQVGVFLSLWTACSNKIVPGQSGLYTETLFCKKHKKVSWYELTINVANSVSGSKWRIHQN